MAEAVSLSTLKNLIERKIKKKVLIKVMWNDHEKITLFITPNMKINSFIFDQKEGYLFYDNAGKLIEYVIPCVLSEEQLIDGKVMLGDKKNRKLMINNQTLSKEDRDFIRE